MKKITLQHLTKAAIIVGIFTLALTANYLLAAWQAAPADPPTQNQAFPLNTGIGDQIKDAGLNLLALVVNGPVQIQDGSEGNNKVLVSDDIGAASWQATSTLGVTGSGGGSEPLTVTIVSTNDPNNESCSATCPADTELIGGGCTAVPEAPLQVNGPSGGDTWQCQTSPNMSFGGYSGGLTCRALCSEGNTTNNAGGSPPTCADGEIFVYNSSTGDWECSAPPSSGSGITQLDEDNGIVLSPAPITATGSVAADMTYLQRRITGSCASGEGVRSIAADGTVQCEPIVAGSNTCIYEDRVYNSGDTCTIGRAGRNCSSSYSLNYLACQPDGTWSSGATSCGYFSKISTEACGY